MNSVFLDLGIIQIYWYSVFIFLGLLAGGAIALFEARRFKIPEDFMVNLFFYMIPIALIGARLYYVLFNWNYYNLNRYEIFQVWQGGLAIHGAIIFGAIWLFIYSKRYKISTIRLMDIMVVGLLMGQAVGRWGNFFNQEAFGPATTLSFLQNLHLPKFIIDGMLINGVYYQPTFLYESIWCLIGFVFIFFFRRNQYIKTGQVTSFYLVWYGIGRLFIESLRTDSLMFSSFKMAQVISILMIIGGIILFLVKRKGSVFDNRYNDGGENHEVRF